MDYLMELVKIAEQEEKEFKRLDDEMNAETEDMIKFRKLEIKANKQYKRFMVSLHKVKRCTKDLINFYDYI